MATDQSTHVKEKESTSSSNGKLYDRPEFKEKYDNFIGGGFVAPVDGNYFDDIAPMDGKPFTKVARSNEKDIELALDVKAGRGSSFSIEIPLGVRFVIKSRLFKEDELEALAEEDKQV